MFSIFSFSGYNSDVQTPSNLVVQTELVLSQNPVELQVFSFYDFIPATNPFNDETWTTIRRLAILHGKWAKRQLTNRPLPHFSFSKKHIAFQALKTIPSSEEESVSDFF